MSSVPRAERRLGLALALYLGLVISIVTLVPFRFVWPPDWRLVGYRGLSDVVANVALFLPLGFFVAFGGRGSATAAGFGLSLAVELLQLTLPGRAPSLLDLASNSLGAGLGSLAFALTGRARERPERTRVFALDLPLMGLVYLLVPLLWLSGLASGGDAERPWLAIPVLAVGALALGAIDRHSLRPRGTGPMTTPWAGAAGAAVGLAPGWASRPGLLIAMAVGTGLATAAASRLLAAGEALGTRYERRTLARIALPLGLYLAAVAVWPLDGLVGVWRVSLTLAGDFGGPGQTPILRLLELVAAVTVTGYAVAEAGGRARGRLGTVATLGLVTAALVGLRGFHRAYGASMVETALLLAGAGLGARLYRLQRRYVQAILGRPAGATSAGLPHGSAGAAGGRRPEVEVEHAVAGR